MINPFPADVSVRVQGNDIQGAQKLFAEAANLLFKALEFQRVGNRTNVNMQHTGNDGSAVRVVIAGNIKQVFITPPPVEIVVEEEPPELEQPEVGVVIPYLMYSGVAKPDSDIGGSPMIVAIANPDPPPTGTVPALEVFHPDDVTAAAYNLDPGWQTVPKLGVNADGAADIGFSAAYYPKPGMYSGAMKRVVQALLGIGNVLTETRGYISGELPASYPDLAVFNPYEFGFEKTHGIYKGDDGGIWLIEISRDNGVLAMPLVTFDGTGGLDYMSLIDGYGDSDTLGVLLEFGGIPTGESFPTGSELDDAIAGGLVLQLLDADGIADFYHDADNDVDKDGPPTIGWAFSETGKNVDNITFWYKNHAIATAPWPNWATDGFNDAAIELRYMTCQHWRLAINISQATTDGAIGSGTALLSLVEEKLILCDHDLSSHPTGFPPEYYSAPVFRYGVNDDTERLDPWRFFGRNSSTTGPDLPAGDAPMFVFYVGETPEVVRYSAATGDFFARGSFYGDSLSFGVPAQPTLNSAGLILPCFCREGYVLIFGHQDGSGAGDFFSVEVKGYFAQLGEVVFPTIVEVALSTLVFGLLYEMITWPSLWCNYPSGGYSYTGNFPMFMAVVINAGPTRAAVTNHGLFVHANEYHSTLRPQETRYDRVNVTQYEIASTVPAHSITFVGSP